MDLEKGAVYFGFVDFAVEICNVHIKTGPVWSIHCVDVHTSLCGFAFVSVAALTCSQALSLMKCEVIRT